MRAPTLALLLLLAPAPSGASGLSGAEGHPRARFPLGVHAAPVGDATLDAAIRRAVDDWNMVAREVLGIQSFTWDDQPGRAQVSVAFAPPASPRAMGETELRVAPDGVIGLPVRIVVFEVAPRGETPAETLLYQIVAHELGHALGLAHVLDPRSVMCCVSGSIDFNDLAARQAYVDARRHPDLRSAASQLRSHSDRFWNR